ncbi:hypothetical protein CBF34_07185 [Vagococcus penaei]|uniref:hypothetical protein n=1 Tax=Vagococcus penaei TaxID=633807 RepID=UPI000F888738|nr:hypothetical protein [Vagococcus penaei]RSU01434.1 hypothetical protein CBF34_07185 [Vagococcus penaei]
MISQFLKPSLKGAFKRTDKSQKYVAVDTKTPNATLSDHVNGKQPVNINKAIEYARSLQDSKFYTEVASKFVGTPPTMDDVKYKLDVRSLETLSRKEEKERKQAFEDIELILAIKESEWTKEERDKVLAVALELIDELVVKSSMLNSLLDFQGLTIVEGVEMRQSYLIQQKYIRKG